MSDDKKDLTKITDLSEFIHEDDPDIDAQLTSGKPDEDDGPPDTPAEDMASLDDLDDDESSGFEEASFDSNDSDDSGFGDDSEDSTDFGDDSENAFTDSESDDENDMSFDSDDDNTFGDDSDDSFGGDSFGDETEDNAFGEDHSEEATDFSSDDDNSFGDDEAGFGNDSEDSEEDSFESDDSFGDDSDSSDEMSFGEDDNSTEEAEEGSFETTEVSEPEPEPEPEPTPEPVASPPPKENFEEVKQFAKNISYGVVAAGGNPPYSLIIKNIRFKEDAEDILIILREHGLVNDGNEETMKQGLDNGSVLISQISEYSAIYLAHRMRRFDVELLVGLSEELHPSKTYDKTNVGLVTKKTLRKNRKDTLDLSDKPVSLESILMATTPALENYVVKKYISIATEHRVVDESELEVLQHAKRETEEKAERQEFNYFDKNEDELLADISLGLDEVYQELAAGLKSQCLKNSGNAVIGINFQLTPLVVRTGDQSSVKYKITATGNIVWVVDAGRPGLEL